MTSGGPRVQMADLLAGHQEDPLEGEPSAQAAEQSEFLKEKFDNHVAFLSS